MIASARRLYIIKRLNELGIIDYKSIARELDVSEATVRRDFIKLENQGSLRRVQGGAIRSEEDLENNYQVELSMQSKHTVNTEAKQMVARAAAEVVQPGECVFLDMGTSIGPLAPILLAMPIRIVTCNTMVLRQMKPNARAEVFVIGGQYMPADHMIVGSIAECTLRKFGLHHAFIGCMGLDIHNNTVYATDMDVNAIKQVAIQNATDAYLLADRSKLSKVGLFRIAGLDAFTTVYLDGPSPEEDFPSNVVFVEEET